MNYRRWTISLSFLRKQLTPVRDVFKLNVVCKVIYDTKTEVNMKVSTKDKCVYYFLQYLVQLIYIYIYNISVRLIYQYFDIKPT